MKLCGALCLGLAATACGGVARDGTGRGGVPTPGAGGDGGGTSVITIPAAGGAPNAGSGNGGLSFGGGGGSNTGGSSVTAGAAGRAAGGAGGAVIENCTQTNDHARIGMTPIVADGGGPLQAFVDGRVVTTSPTTFDIDSCPAGSDCDAQVTLFTVDAPGLDVSSVLPLGALARVHYKMTCGYGCASEIAVTPLESWSGYSNPALPPSGMYLAADDGGDSVSEMPYAIGRILLDCDAYPVGRACSENPGLYTLEFDFDDASWVIVHMGEEQLHPYRGGAVRIRNLRSFETGYCDDDTNWAHWVVNASIGL